MASDNELFFPTAIDIAGLDRDILAAEAMVDDFASTSAAKLQSLPSARIKLDTAFDSSSTSSALLPISAAICVGIIGTVKSLTKVVKDAAKSISKQLQDSFNFAKAQDGINTTKDIFHHRIGSMRDDLATFARTGGSNLDAFFDKTRKKIIDADHQFEHFLNHAAANLKKGQTLPSFDTFFSNASKVYKGKGETNGSNSKLGFLVKKLNPIKSVKGEADVGSLSLLKLGAAGAVAGVAIGAIAGGLGFLKHGISNASDLAETINRVDVSLGTGAPKVKAFADELQTKFGIAKNTSLDTAASFAGIGKSLGRLNGEKLTGFSTQFTMMAADFSSFANIDVAQAGDALRTVLSGNQSDTLKELGVVLTEDTLKTYAYSHAIAQAGTELNEQQKFAARTALITEGLSRVHGDLEKTQGGAANQTRKLMGTIEGLGTSIGTALLPAVTAGLQALNEFTSWVAKGFEDNKSVIADWTESIIGGIDWVVAVVHNFPAAFQVARIKIGETLINIGEWISVLGPNAILVASYIANNWTRLISDAFNFTITGLKNLWTNWQNLGTAIGAWFAGEKFEFNWTPLLDGFKATADQFPGLIKPVLTDMSAQIAEASKPITEEVIARRAKRAIPAAAAKLVDTPIGDEALKEKSAKSRTKSDKDELKFSGALELGSKEAYSSVVSATSGRTKGMDELNRSSRDTAANTARIANALDNPRERNQRPIRLEIA